MRFTITTVIILAFWFGVACADEGSVSGTGGLRVIDPYADVHTGPGRGYPVFYVVAQGESIILLSRRPGWYRVRSASGREGWVSEAQIARTLQSSGEPADLPSVGYGDYLQSRWYVGFSAGQFTGGELQGSDTFSFAAGYRMWPWLGIEAELGKVLGTDIRGDLGSLNLVFEPFSQWRLSPLVTLGRGRLSIDSQPKLVPLEIGSEDYTLIGLGSHYYVGRNFVLNAEYRGIRVELSDNAERLDLWKIGFSAFF